ncbi:MAG: fluoride efflux transporter CrcB, partial [Mesorhizobium sp.]
MSLAACALVLIGGFLGGVSRFFLSGLVGRSVGETFPWG